MAKFKNPNNGYTQSVSQAGAFFGCLAFGVFYFAYKGAWRHALVSFGAAFCTLGISWLIYPFFAYRCVEHSYLERGWRPVGQARKPSPAVGHAKPSFDNIP
jgi:hypothetical protein